jgi:hypothetical protein
MGGIFAREGEQRMSGTGGMGTLVLSIDLELDLQGQRSEQPEQLDQARRQLLEMTREYSVPATWAVADPVRSVATESIRAAGANHEIAVLGDRAWLGPGCGRLRLERELARRFDGARKAGIPATTLALRNLDQVCELDLLRDHGITALRGPAGDAATAADKHAAAPIRFGIWQVPPGWKVPVRSSWWLPGSWTIRRQIKRSTARQSIVHLQIDAPRLIATGDREVQTLRRLLRYAAIRRDAGHLAIRTIGQIAAETLAERAATPSRSILRPAA